MVVAVEVPAAKIADKARCRGADERVALFRLLLRICFLICTRISARLVRRKAEQFAQLALSSPCEVNLGFRVRNSSVRLEQHAAHSLRLCLRGSLCLPSLSNLRASLPLSRFRLSACRLRIRSCRAFCLASEFQRFVRRA